MSAGLCLIRSGRPVSGERVYEYSAGQFLVVTVDLPLVSQITRASADEPFVAFGMPLRGNVIASLLLDAPTVEEERSRISKPAGATAATPALAVSDADDELLGGIGRLLRLVRDPLDYRVLSAGLIRELHWRLLSGPQAALVRQVGMPDSRLALVARAIRWLQEHFDEPLRADDLARLVGLSISSLNRHFRAVTSLSPLQYQKTLRLQQARLELLAAPGDVARIAHAVGYGSPSQFSREYRRKYGAPPSTDAARLQTAVVSTEF